MANITIRVDLNISGNAARQLRDIQSAMNKVVSNLPQGFAGLSKSIQSQMLQTGMLGQWDRLRKETTERTRGLQAAGVTIGSPRHLAYLRSEIKEQKELLQIKGDLNEASIDAIRIAKRDFDATNIKKTIQQGYINKVMEGVEAQRQEYEAMGELNRLTGILLSPIYSFGRSLKERGMIGEGVRTEITNIEEENRRAAQRRLVMLGPEGIGLEMSRIRQRESQMATERVESANRSRAMASPEGQNLLRAEAQAVLRMERQEATERTQRQLLLNTERYGQTLGRLVTRIESPAGRAMEELAGTGLRGAAIGMAGITGLVAAASPELFSTWGRSWEYLAATIGQAFLPAITEASRRVQGMAGWIRSVDSGTKQWAGDIIFTGGALAGTGFLLYKLYTGTARLLSLFGATGGALSLFRTTAAFGGVGFGLTGLGTVAATGGLMAAGSAVGYGISQLINNLTARPGDFRLPPWEQARQNIRMFTSGVLPGVSILAPSDMERLQALHNELPPGMRERLAALQPGSAAWRAQITQEISGLDPITRADVGQDQMARARQQLAINQRMMLVRMLDIGRGDPTKDAQQLLLSMGNFQPQQIGIDALHDLVQQNVIRAPLEQAIFEVQREGFAEIIRSLSAQGDLYNILSTQARQMAQGMQGGGQE
jgi:hypothetical protein